MQAIALIVEYNPLHNGHLHHIQEAKKRFPKATIIAILNGDFLQRGEPALLDKFTRASWAIQSGCDLVLELPFAFGTQRADIFARGSVLIANAFGVDALVYGIETPLPTKDTLQIEKLLPNQRLAYFYQQAVETINPAIHLVPIERIHSGYNDVIASHHQIASATAIRQLLQKNIEKSGSFVPSYVLVDLEQHEKRFATLSAYFPFLQYSLLQKEQPPTALSQFGLSQSIQKQLEQATNFSDFFENIHHKHTSRTHIQRLLTYRLCGVTQEMLDEATQHIWTRILGATKQGQLYVKYYKKTHDITIPLIEKLNTLQKPHDMIQYKSMIAYALITKQSIETLKKREYNRNNIRIGHEKEHLNKET